MKSDAANPKTRAPVERFRVLMARLLAARSPIPAQQLADELGVTYKTIDRDLNFMRDRLHLPIVAKRDGQWLNEKIQVCPCCAGRMK